MLLVVVLAATTPAASFKLPWSRSAPKSGGYQLGDISKAVYQTWKDQKDGKFTPAVSDAYDDGYRGRSEFALDMPRPEFKYCPPREMSRNLCSFTTTSAPRTTKPTSRPTSTRSSNGARTPCSASSTSTP